MSTPRRTYTPAEDPRVRTAVVQAVEEAEARPPRSRARKTAAEGEGQTQANPAAAGRRRAQARAWKQRAAKAKGERQQHAEREGKALLREQVAARDAAAQRGGAARRAALQARTPATVRSREHARWEQALAHEHRRPPPRGVMEQAGEYVAGRAVLIPMLADEPVFASRKDIEAYLTEHATLNPNIRTKHQVAHLVASWEAASVHPGAAAATAARLCARIGIDPQQQHVVTLLHLDGQHAHLHILAARVREDGGAWVPGLGVDRALALEAESMARDHGQAWDQRMIARSKRSGVAAAAAARGELYGEVRYEDGTRTRVPWQGAEVVQRREADPWAVADHAGVCLARLVGYRPAARLVAYAV